MKTRIYLLVSIFFLLTAFANAQDSESWKNHRGFGVAFGLSQALVLDGFNTEINYIHNRFVFGYSHGMSLNLESDLMPEYLQEQGLVAYLPFSTGFGIGYRFYEWLDVRLEAKWHRFEFYYDGEAQTSANRIATDARNISIGLGLYSSFQPFKNADNALSGITIIPNIRFWPTVFSDFDNRSFSYENKITGQTEEIQTPNAGINLSPLIVNMSIGYRF